MIFALLVVVALLVSLVMAISPRFAWYYVLSGHWGRNDMGAPSANHLIALRAMGTACILMVHWFVCL